MIRRLPATSNGAGMLFFLRTVQDSPDDRTAHDLPSSSIADRGPFLPVTLSSRCPQARSCFADVQSQSRCAWKPGFARFSTVPPLALGITPHRSTMFCTTRFGQRHVSTIFTQLTSIHVCSLQQSGDVPVDPPCGTLLDTRLRRRKQLFDEATMQCRRRRSHRRKAVPVRPTRLNSHPATRSARVFASARYRDPKRIAATVQVSLEGAAATFESPLSNDAYLVAGRSSSSIHARMLY